MSWDQDAINEANGKAPPAPEPEPPDRGPGQAPQHDYQGGEQYQPPEPQYQPQQPEPLPDVQDDPIGHFTRRAQELETFALNQAYEGQRRDFAQRVLDSEKAWNEEVPDYHEATSHLLGSRQRELERMLPDTNEGQVFAHHYGFQSAGHMRESLLERNRIDLIEKAMKRGLPPAQYAYAIAVERGYQPKVAITNSQRRQLSRAIAKANESGDYASFDKLWDTYSRVSKAEDERSRGR